MVYENVAIGVVILIIILLLVMCVMWAYQCSSCDMVIATVIIVVVFVFAIMALTANWNTDKSYDESCDEPRKTRCEKKSCNKMDNIFAVFIIFAFLMLFNIGECKNRPLVAAFMTLALGIVVTGMVVC